MTWTLQFVDATNGGSSAGQPFWLSGSVSNYADLPQLSANRQGQVWLVTSSGLLYVWGGAAWPAESNGVAITSGGSGAVASVNGKVGAVVLAAADVGALPAGTPLFSGKYADLSGKPTIPAAQVQADWNAPSGLAAILNKPTSWAWVQITGKPAFATVATSGAYGDLSGRPTIPATAADVGAATAAQGTKADSALQSVVAGTGIAVDNTDPLNPKINATGGGGGGVAGVSSINGQTGDVTLTLFSGAYADLSGKPTLGSAAAQDTSAFATAAQGALAATAVQPAGNVATATKLAAARTIAGVSFDGSANIAIPYGGLTGLPTIPAAQVQSDWNAASGVAAIANKPTLGTAASHAATDFASAAPVAPTAVSGAAYTLALADAGAGILTSNSGAVAVTVPASSAVAFPIGSRVPVRQGGGGAVTVVAGSGVTLNAPNGAATAAPGDGRVVELVSSDTWQIW